MGLMGLMGMIGLMGHSCVEGHFTEEVGIYLDLLGSDELLALFHGNDCWLSLEVEDKELASLLVCELLGFLGGFLLADVEEPVFEEDDDFFHNLMFIMYLCRQLWKIV